MTPIQQMLLGVGAKEKTYVDDLFSTHLWHGNAGTNRSFNNGINLSGEGGMTWIKRRNSGGNHTIYDTVRTATKAIYPNSNDFGDTLTNGLKSFNSNGFTVGNHGNHNTSTNPYVSYSFRKAKGFFDVVTWTGNQTANRKISHSLGSVPGAILIKRLGGSTGTNVSDWVYYNRGSDSEQYPQNYLQFLNRNVAASNDGAGNYLYNTVPTADEFTIGSHVTVNATGNDYIAYIFAHNDAQFGEDGDESIIKCGYYSGNDSSDGTVVNLGWEPQWVLLKRNNHSEDWMLFDNMRGVRTELYDKDFRVNSSEAEADNRDWIDFQSRGFKLKSPWAHVNASGSRYTYIAIRAATGTMTRPPEAGTDVFAMDNGNASYTIPAFNSGFPVDFAMYRSPTSAHDWMLSTRHIDGKFLKTNATTAEGTASSFKFSDSDGFGDGGNSMPTGDQAWMWKRHAGFDCIAPKVTTESGYPSYNHSLGVVPEMIWAKRRDYVTDWTVYHKGLNGGTNAFNWRVRLNETAAEYEDSNLWGVNDYPSATSFNAKGSSFGAGDWIFLLFASVSGISSVGSYTGNGSTTGPIITTGFQPRLIMLKRADDSGSWYWYDTLRGISSGNDHRIELNDSAGESSGADDVDVLSTGFQLKHTWDNLNGNGGKYIYYAHA